MKTTLEFLSCAVLMLTGLARSAQTITFIVITDREHQAQKPRHARDYNPREFAHQEPQRNAKGAYLCATPSISPQKLPSSQTLLSYV
jgi:hypothetical protein